MAAEEHRRFWALGAMEVPAPDSVTLRRPAGARLGGRVVDVQGQPVAGALIVLSQPVHPLQTTPGQYELMVLPAHGKGLGMVLGKISLEGTRQQELALPADPATYRVYGLVADEPGMPDDELLLQWVDEGTGRIAQTTDRGLRNYTLRLPAGHYQVRAGRLSPVGGFQQLYEIGAVSIDGDTRWDIDLADAATAVAEEAVARPQGFAIDPNYPNPFNPTTTFRFSLPQPGEAELAIYNLLGQRVATLVKGMQEAGPQVLQWDGRDARGRELGSGVYFYRLEAGAQVQTRKLLLLR